MIINDSSQTIVSLGLKNNTIGGYTGAYVGPDPLGSWFILNVTSNVNINIKSVGIYMDRINEIVIIEVKNAITDQVVYSYNNITDGIGYNVLYFEGAQLSEGVYKVSINVEFNYWNEIGVVEFPFSCEVATLGTSNQIDFVYFGLYDWQLEYFPVTTTTTPIPTSTSTSSSTSTSIPSTTITIPISLFTTLSSIISTSTSRTSSSSVISSTTNMIINNNNITETIIIESVEIIIPNSANVTILNVSLEQVPANDTNQIVTPILTITTVNGSQPVDGVNVSITFDNSANLTNDTISDYCLAARNTSLDNWTCVDQCLTLSAENNTISGETPHFTSFAILVIPSYTLILDDCGRVIGKKKSSSGWIWISSITLLCSFFVMAIFVIILGIYVPCFRRFIYGTEGERINILRSDKTKVISNNTITTIKSMESSL